MNICDYWLHILKAKLKASNRLCEHKQKFVSYDNATCCVCGKVLANTHEQAQRYFA